ncbi:unnamed protein product [Leptidea sinapis]|uniref:Band 4.1 domain-containing protein n=1 Tax=Leptidea sinapis TaxID=189913 RepID=A0A5E4QE18_9NEOP|nr:unnamed protein product [Leptidea sinapis]
MFKSRGDSNIVYKCTVRLLEDTEILECEFHPSYKGKFLLEHVCQQLNLSETDYFGLRYVDSNGQRHWLHLAKLILKQVKVELGDYDPSIHVGNYVTEMRLLLRQTDTIEARIQEIHRESVEGTPGGTGGVKGMSTQEAERSFLKIACQLDTYGVDPHPVKVAIIIRRMRVYRRGFVLVGDKVQVRGENREGDIGEGRVTAAEGPPGYSSLPRSTHSAPLEDSAGLRQSVGGACPEYNIRDSFEHSSTESGATTHATHVSHGSQPADDWRPPALHPPPRPFSLIRAFVPSFLFVWLSLALVALLLFETDWSLLRSLRRKPEIVSLRHHYYAPLKEYLKKKIVELF